MSALTTVVLAQNQPITRPNDTVSIARTPAEDTVKNMVNDSNVNNLEAMGLRISPDALSEVVTATGTDSAVLDLEQNLFYLYGQVQVTYDDLKLGAGAVVFNQATSTLNAVPRYDTSGVAYDKPTFAQGQETFTYDSLQYNFKSKRAIVLNARTQYGEGFVFSQQVKRNPDQSIYGWNNVYTTCSLEDPHYGIRARRIRVIPNRVIASGAANLVLEDVPTPLYLPFGIFPLSQKQRSGFILPTYTVEQVRGLGLINGGYYFNLGHHADLQLTTNIYSKGSWGMIGVVNYADRYRYNGMLRLSYAYNKQGEVYEQNGGILKEFFINWNHSKDGKSRPGINFNANVNLGSSNYFTNNSYNVNQILNNQYTSNITFQKTWLNKPFNLTISARHNQNTNTHVVEVNLPDVQFYINPQTPFQRKQPVGKVKWYEKISIGYSLNGKNKTQFVDSQFSIGGVTINQFNNGIIHNIPVSASYNILKYFNLSFNANYNEYWLSEKLYTGWDPTNKGIDSNSERGFFTARDFLTSATLNTRIYGIKMFKNGGVIKGVRHELKPRISYTYRPDFGASPYNYSYQRRIDSTTYETTSPFITSPVSYPPLGKQGTINMGISNNLQLKVKSGKDTVTGTKNISLFDDISIGTNYNIAADSFKWSPLDFSFRTNLLDKLNITGGANWDFYDYDQANGTRLKTTKLSNGHGFANFRSAGMALQASFHSKKDSRNKPVSEEAARLLTYESYDYVDFNIPWNFNAAYSINYTKIYRGSKPDTCSITQSLRVNGDFNLTERWKIAITTGYDFTQKELTLTSIDVYRDLHCWEMRLGAIPFGRNKSYNFTINVKSTVLQDLKLVRRRNFRDAVY